ncbi:hypothetical protein PROH_10125 [Prochlorothrix hollandica PCC 9006 = CALU 1027]|uniref:DUF2283 domain-containing protein n=1 Tax=Prochlorothrix hollandica PCC 9006 = CALU 1027 TaxID=317619 RepID=A0A0M2PWJ5_PROHO|nr:hypothetical protein PROH_10125 [Prochlorothrix hollandica PCC 9006 = CALU 1027]
MADRGLTFDYDPIGDSLMVRLCPIYTEQETEELGDDLLVRLNPETGAIEAIEIFFWSRRLAAQEPIFVPVVAMLRAGG